jgi:hypothetical protein
MIEPHVDRPRASRWADKAYDAENFVNDLRSMKVTPRVAQNTSGRTSAIDGRTTRVAPPVLVCTERADGSHGERGGGY